MRTAGTFAFSSLMVLHRRLHQRTQSRLVVHPGRIVTIALNGRINDWPLPASWPHRQDLFHLSAWHFDFGSIEFGCPATLKPTNVYGAVQPKRA
jgi:hypothetical protein